MKNVSEVLVDRILEKLIENNSIDDEDVEVYKFGVETILLKALHYTSYFVIALCLNKLLEFVIIFVVFYIFRRNTGGFHAKTRIGCYLFSCAVIFLSLFVSELTISWWVAAMISILDIIVLLILSPVRNSNRNLDMDEIACFRHRLRIISVIYVVVYIATIILGTEYFTALFTIGLTMDTVLTILGTMQSIKQS